MSTPTLITDLQNLSNEYLDPLSYLKLIAENPKAFNKKTYLQILKNYETQFPLQFYTETWNKALELIEYTKDYIYMGDAKIDPKYMSSIVIKYATTTFVDIEGVDDYRDEIFEEVDTVIKNNNDLFDTDYGEVLEFTDDQKLVEEIEKLNPENRKSLFIEARKILIETDSDVYDTTEPLGREFSEKMIPIIKSLLEKKLVSSKKLPKKIRSPRGSKN